MWRLWFVFLEHGGVALGIFKSPVCTYNQAWTFSLSASQYFSFPRASVAGGVYKYRPRSEAPCTEYMSSCIVRVHTRTAFHYCCADQQLSHCYQDQQIRCNCPCRTPCIGKRTCPMLTPVSRQLISRLAVFSAPAPPPRFYPGVLVVTTCVSVSYN